MSENALAGLKAQLGKAEAERDELQKDLDYRRKECDDAWRTIKELKVEVEKLKQFIHKRHKEHYECEDGYYSCPHAENAFDWEGNDYDDDFDKPCYCGKLEADDLLWGWKAQKEGT